MVGRGAWAAVAVCEVWGVRGALWGMQVVVFVWWGVKRGTWSVRCGGSRRGDQHLLQLVDLAVFRRELPLIRSDHLVEYIDLDVLRLTARARREPSPQHQRGASGGARTLISFSAM